LLALLDDEWPVVHVDANISAAEVKSVIGDCDLLVGSRYHALIAALSQGIPVAAIGWSHKYEELLKEANLSANMLSLGDSTVQVLTSVDSIIEHLSQSRTSIQSRLPGIKASAATALEVLVSGIEATL
jgi:colanic acid/amylovoran biosynthesis protein